MFSLTELAPFNQHQCRFKLLKPWWEVFTDYFVVLMLLISVLACTEHLSRDKVVCLPLVPLESDSDQASAGVNRVSTPSSKPLIHADNSNFQPAARGRRTHLVFQQYVYISQVLYVCSFGLVRTLSEKYKAKRLESRSAGVADLFESESCFMGTEPCEAQPLCCTLLKQQAFLVVYY